eukprot:EC720030.1.p3 GENE.EC720030.1~~EC720030.1.p3  ORF type:complete len:70 (+),score=15.42 EC720030.1:259-468(+)
MMVAWVMHTGSFALKKGFYEAMCHPNQEVWAAGSLSAVSCYMFMWSKFFEVLDTVFLVFREKEVITMHW